MLKTGIKHTLDLTSTFSYMTIITNHVEWYHRYFSNKCTCCTDTALLSRRAYVQTYFMMDKSSGIIMVMISCRTQRHQVVEKLFQVLTVIDKCQELQTRATSYDMHANECYFYICEQVSACRRNELRRILRQVAETLLWQKG